MCAGVCAADWSEQGAAPAGGGQVQQAPPDSPPAGAGQRPGQGQGGGHRGHEVTAVGGEQHVFSGIFYVVKFLLSLCRVIIISFLVYELHKLIFYDLGHVWYLSCWYCYSEDLPTAP